MYKNKRAWINGEKYHVSEWGHWVLSVFLEIRLLQSSWDIFLVEQGGKGYLQLTQKWNMYEMTKTILKRVLSSINRKYEIIHHCFNNLHSLTTC